MSYPKAEIRMESLTLAEAGARFRAAVSNLAAAMATALHMHGTSGRFDANCDRHLATADRLRREATP